MAHVLDFQNTTVADPGQANHSNYRISMLERIPQLETAWRAGTLGDAEYAALYFLYWQIHKHGARFAARISRGYPAPRIEAVLNSVDTLPPCQLVNLLAEYMEQYRFLGVTAAVNHTLANWLRQRWRLNLCDYVPTPAQVLAMQVQGARPVTLIAQYPRMLEAVLKKNDAFEFMLHDLEHAFKYFHDDSLHSGQRALFTLLQRAMDRGLFEAYVQEPVFADQLDYLLSDMNTHPVHGLQYLRAMLVDYYLRRDNKQPREALPAQAARELCAWVKRLIKAGEFSGLQQQHLAAFFAGTYDDTLARELVSLLRDFFDASPRRQDQVLPWQ